MAICIGVALDKNGEIGWYRLLDSINGKIKDFRIYEIAAALKMNKMDIDNLALASNNKIISTAGSIDRYPVINKNKNMNNLTVLAKYPDSSAYYCINCNGIYKTISRDIIDKHKSELKFTNAKIVNDYLVSLGSKIPEMKLFGVNNQKVIQMVRDYIKIYIEKLNKTMMDYLAFEDKGFKYSKKDIKLDYEHIDESKELNRQSAFNALVSELYRDEFENLLKNKSGLNRDEYMSLLQKFKNEQKIRTVVVYQVSLMNKTKIEFGLYEDRKTMSYYFCAKETTILNDQAYIEDHVYNIGEVLKVDKIPDQAKPDVNKLNILIELLYKTDGIYDNIYKVVNNTLELK